MLMRLKPREAIFLIVPKPNSEAAKIETTIAIKIAVACKGAQQLIGTIINNTFTQELSGIILNKTEPTVSATTINEQMGKDFILESL